MLSFTVCLLGMIQNFVILEHDHPFLHWDFLLDTGEALKSWRLLTPPTLSTWIPAEALPDHRRIYLEYEGKVSGNRGTVKQIFNGKYSETTTLNDGQRRFTITECSFCKLAIHRQAQDGSIEWRFE